ncbi:MAG: tRNA (N6-threonylcarbamoyladenosine(37)-N6)-methyltransferase TrmO [Halodesulfurarchaeum sp.]
MSEEICYSPIGTIHSPFDDEEGMPIQGGFSEASGRIEIDEEYADGLADLDGFSHVIVLYHFHRSEGYELRPRPYMDDSRRGVFATRAPRRPNSIGLSVVELDGISETTVSVEGIDVLDGTPVLDLKPFVPEFNGVDEARIGWLEETIENEKRRRADDRFLG